MQCPWAVKARTVLCLVGGPNLCVIGLRLASMGMTQSPVDQAVMSLCIIQGMSLSSGLPAWQSFRLRLEFMQEQGSLCVRGVLMCVNMCFSMLR